MAAGLTDLTPHLVSTENPTTGFSHHEDVTNSDNLVLENFQYLNISVRLLMGLLAISCNLLTVVAIGRYDYLRSCTNYLIAALAIGDMIGGINCLLVFFNFLYPMTDETWIKMCAVEFTFSQISAGLNLSYILWISVDRFIFINFPLRYSSLVTTKLIIGAILVPCVLLAVHFTVVHLDPEGYKDMPERVCISMFPPRINFTINLWFYVTTPCTVLLYSRIAWIAYRQSRAIEQAQLPPREANNRKQYKITKMLSLVLGVYFACYLPFMVVSGINGNAQQAYKIILSRIASWIWWINSWVNPFIYAWKNKNFNRAFRSLLGLRSPAIDPMQANPAT